MDMNDTVRYLQDMRGVLGCFIQFMGGLGILLTFVLGYWANWWQLAAAISSLVLPFALGMVAVPESPHWYLAKGEYSLFTVSITPPFTRNGPGGSQGAGVAARLRCEEYQL